tara:strand:- start:1544 stop:3634 length:2091 start_codon:yes stop_codon:yes gene_type:complete
MATKKDIEFSTYIERDLTKSVIDWGTISKTLTDDLTRIQKERAEKKAEIEEKTLEADTTINTLEQYDNTDLGGLALGMSGESAKFLQTQNNLFKRGLISQTEFAQARQRVLADWKSFSSITKQWNDDYKSYVNRINDGSASNLEKWLNTQNVAFGNLENVQGYVNPQTGRLSLVEVDPKTGVPSDDPGKHVSMNTINQRFKTQYTKIDPTQLVKGKVDELGALLIETLGSRQEVMGAKGWGTKKDDAKFQAQMRDQAKGLMSDDNVAVLASSASIGAQPTYDKNDIKEGSTDFVLMKIVGGRPVLDTDAKNITSIKNEVEDLLYGNMMIQLDTEFTVEKGFEVTSELADKRIRGQIESQEYRDELAGKELTLKNKRLELDKEVAAGNMKAQEAATILARDNYDLNVLKYETNDGLVNAQIDKMYADIDLGKEKLKLAELTGDRNYKIALMNETYKSKLLKEKEKEGIVPYTYPDPNKTMPFGDFGETTGAKFIQEKLGPKIKLDDQYWTTDTKAEVQSTIGEYIKGMLDPNVYNELAEAGGFDVQWNKDGSGVPKNELGLVITVGGVKYPFPPQPASEREIKKLMNEDRSLSREQVEKQINDSNGYNEFTSKGFIPEGYTFWGEGSRGITDLAGDKDYGVQNTEAFFSWINEFILNPSTTAAIALQEPPEDEEVNYIERIQGGAGDSIFEEEEIVE